MPITINTTPLSHRDMVAQKVETNSALSAAGWSTQANVLCDRLSMVVNGIDTAQLTYYFGDVKQFGESSFPGSPYDPADLRGKFVRVTIDEGGSHAVQWVGYILEESQLLEGNSASGGKLSGFSQVFTAVGLEWFLDRERIETTEITINAANVTLKRAVPFNLGAGRYGDSRKKGNMKTTPESGNLYRFHDDLAEAAEWQADYIAEHVFTYHHSLPSPNVFKFESNSRLYLDWFKPAVYQEGRTAFSVLNELASPNRGLGWKIVQPPPSLGTEVEIEVFSYSSSAILMPSLKILPANANDVELPDFDVAGDVIQPQLTYSGQRKFTDVHVLGAKRVVCFTLSPQDGNLQADWTSLEEADYKTEVDGTTGWGALSTAAKSKRADEFRKSEKFAAVFSRFRIPEAWDFKSGDGNGALENFVCPELLRNGNLSTVASEKAWVNGMRFLPRLPIKEQFDYSTGGTPTSSAPAGTDPPYVRPFVLFLDHTDGGNSYVYGDKMDNKGEDGEDGKYSASFSLANIDGPGFALHPSKGLPHLLADGAIPNTEFDPEVDWTTMLATVAVEWDARVDAWWPTTAPAANIGGASHTLQIYVGDAARLDQIAPNTVFSTDNGAIVKTGTVSYELRDDRKLLQDLARAAFEWHSVDRSAFSFGFRQLQGYLEPGMLIVELGQGPTLKTVNAVVSSVVYDLLEGVTQIKTDFADVDFALFLQ